MAHNHSHNHSHGHSHNHSSGGASKNIVIAFILNFCFVIVEIIGGIMTNSIAILSDALHDFGDCISLAVSWVVQKKSTKLSDNKYSYGYKRFSLLGSVFLSGVLTLTSGFLIYKAIGRILEPEEVHAKGMLWMAILGILVNGAAAFRLKKGESLNERAVYIHIMEDVLGWVAVLVASIVMMFVDFPALDSILSIVITIWVLFNVFKNLRATFKVFLQAIPDGINVEDFKKELESIKGVQAVHDLHVWTQDALSHVMSVHVVINSKDFSIRKEIKRGLREVAKTHQIDHVTIEIETQDEECDLLAATKCYSPHNHALNNKSNRQNP